MYGDVVLLGSGVGACFFSSFFFGGLFLLRKMCKMSMSLWILLVGILRSIRFLIVALCMMPLLPVVMVIEGRIVHPCWVSDVCSMSFFSSFLVMLAWGSMSLQYV